MAKFPWLSSLLGISTYQAPPPDGLSLESDSVESVRRSLGGQLNPLLQSQTRWYLQDLENAEYRADGGDMSQIARLMRSAKRDGVVAGTLSTRTSGLVRLPKKFRGDPEIIADLEVGHDLEDSVQARSTFDDMCPPAELAAMAADEVLCGIAVGELVPVEGRNYPVLVRLDPEFLRYRWYENRWYYNSIVGLIPITPGDGRWVLHVSARNTPWQFGLWKAIGRAYIRKEHASLHKDNWEGKLANPARVATSPQGAGEAQADDWFRAVMAWGINTVFGMRPGYDVKLLESNGRGWESFNKTIADQNQEIIIAIAGQTVTTDGGAGFQNSDIHKTIRSDLIQATADSLAYTINTQVLPPYIANVWGEERLLERSVVMEWDVTPPKDRNSEAQSMVTTGNAIKSLAEALALTGRELDIDTMCARFNIPILGDVNGDGKPEQEETNAGIDKPETKLRLVSGSE